MCIRSLFAYPAIVPAIHIVNTYSLTTSDDSQADVLEKILRTVHSNKDINIILSPNGVIVAITLEFCGTHFYRLYESRILSLCCVL